MTCDEYGLCTLEKGHEFTLSGPFWHLDEGGKRHEARKCLDLGKCTLPLGHVEATPDGYLAEHVGPDGIRWRPKVGLRPWHCRHRCQGDFEVWFCCHDELWVRRSGDEGDYEEKCHGFVKTVPVVSFRR